jgi:hypothetical protein
MAEVSSFLILWFNSRRSNAPSGFGTCTMCFVISRSTNVLWPRCYQTAAAVSLGQPRRSRQLAQRMASDRNLWLDVAALQFGFNRVEDDLGWHHCKASPEDDRSARGDEVFGHANATRSELLPPEQTRVLDREAEQARLSQRLQVWTGTLFLLEAPWCLGKDISHLYSRCPY